MEFLHTYIFKLRLMGIRPVKVAAVLMFVVAFGAVGVMLLLSSKAATPAVSFEAEDGTQDNTSIVHDEQASAGKAIRFGSQHASDKQK